MAEWKEWDHLLPLALYMVQAQVQSSLGCSSFELLYGRQPRSLLEMTKDAWEKENEEESKGLLEYTLMLKSKLGKLRDLAYSNLERSQEKQKACYDRGKKMEKTINGRLGAGVTAVFQEEVPVGMDRSLQSGWSLREYHVPTTDNSKTKPNFSHKPRKKMDRTPTESSQLDSATSTTEETTLGQLIINPELSKEEKNPLSDTLRPFSNIFSDTPGKTTLAEHTITGEDRETKAIPHSSRKKGSSTERSPGDVTSRSHTSIF